MGQKSPSQGVELSGLSAAISHFLNCFLSSYPNPVAHLPADELVSKKRNKRRKNRPPGAADNTAWAVMTPQELWKNICQEAKNYFDFTLEWCVRRGGWVQPWSQRAWSTPGLGKERWGSQGSWGSSCCLGQGLGCSAPAAPCSETVDQAVETYGLQKITLLREISLKTGIQVGHRAVGAVSRQHWWWPGAEAACGRWAVSPRSC